MIPNRVQDEAKAWYVIESGPGESAFNMALDEALLEAVPRLARPVLRFYAWTEPAASFGYFQRYGEVERLTALRPLVRRPTGGGLVPHDADWTYSLVLPTCSPWYALRARESYRHIHAWIQGAFSRLGVAAALAPEACQAGAGQCFSGHEQSDLVWHGRKIAGAAQRRTRHGLLIQGSVQPPPLALGRGDWQRAMREAAPIEPAARWRELPPDAPLEQRARELAALKYSRAAYNRKR